MSTWTLSKALDLTSFDFLSLGADAVGEILKSDHYRESLGGLTLDIFGDGLHYSHGELLPLGDIFRIDLLDSLDEGLQILDMAWSLLKILSYYNPMTDRWDLDGLHDYLFKEADWFNGSSGDDWLAGRGGNDRLDGNAGIDVAEYRGARTDFTLKRTADGWQLADTRGHEGTDTLVDVERLQFNDSRVALDLDGHAGTVVRLIGALFGKQALDRADLVGAGLSLLDHGSSAEAVSALAAASDLFAQAAGSHSNADFVRQVYRNVVGHDASDADIAPYVSQLDSGTTTQATLALWASETALNAQQIDLAGLSQTGIGFTT
jgi:hypothetical protein